MTSGESGMGFPQRKKFSPLALPGFKTSVVDDKLGSYYRAGGATTEI